MNRHNATHQATKLLFTQKVIILWLKKNLFSTWYNAILTILSLLLLFWIVSGLINWAFTEAQWSVLDANFRLFFAGLYPVDWAT